MVDKIDKIASEKFEEAKNIVNDSTCKITDFDNSRSGVFRINLESQDGTTVMFNCRIVRNVIMEELLISYEIRKDGETVYDVSVNKNRRRYGITEFHKTVEELDEVVDEGFKHGDDEF